MIKDYLVVTEDSEKIREIAKRLVEDVTSNIGGKLIKFYSPLMLSRMDEVIRHYAPELSDEETERLRYKFIYDFWMYGCAVDEEFYLGLKDKGDAEKREYMGKQFRIIYVHHLNQAAGPERVDKLSDKYRLYKTLKPYYKRDVI